MENEDWNLTIEPPSAPVTSLLNLEDVLLSGEGSFLHLYGLADGKSCFLKVFTSSNIHGIVRNPMIPSAHQICIFGGRFCRIITFDLNFKLIEVSLEKHVPYWINDCCWVLHSSSITGLILYFSNNTLSLYDAVSLNIIGTVECQESCILYSAKVLFEPHWDGVVALGGTVFNQIVIWSTTMKSFFQQSNLLERVIHRLTGHKGVILGIDWNPTRRMLCSVSDDRSIRVQELVSHSEGINFEDWSACEFLPRLVLFGHTARVWRARLLESVIISIAEDATCAVWSYEGHMIQKFIGHRGKNICSLEVNKNNEEIYTGGGDGSIRVWNFTSHEDAKTSDELLNAAIVLNPPLNEEKDFPRTIRLIDSTRLLVMTDRGCLLMFNIASKTWIFLMTSTKYSSYCLIEVFNDVVIVANIHGWISLLQTSGMSGSILLEEKLYDGKVHSIHWLSSNEFLTTGPLGDVIVWQIKTNHDLTSIFAFSKYLLPMARQRWVSAATLNLGCDILVCGDRIGSVHIYNYPSSTQEPSNPVTSFPKILGSFGVTCVCCHGDLVYCCGRNGQIHVFKGTSADTFNVVHVFNAYKGFDWLSRVLFTDDSQYIIGFLSDKFVMFDICTNRFLLSFPCGGGHRMWDFNLSNSQSILAFIKKRQIVLQHCHLKSRSSLIKPSHQGLGINCILHINTTTISNRYVDTFVTAGEDGLINFVSALSRSSKIESSCMNDNLSDMKVMSVKGHITGLKAISAIKLIEYVKDGARNLLMVTAGAGGIIKAWHLKIPLEFNQFEGIIHNRYFREINNEKEIEGRKTKICNSSQQSVMLKKLCEHVLNTKYQSGCKPWRHFETNEMLEARYMSIDTLHLPNSFKVQHDLVLVFAGCSLGFIRTFVLNRNTNKFELFGEFDFHEHCILKVKHFIHRAPSSGEECVWLLSTATDGQVAFWDLTINIKEFLQKSTKIASPTYPSFTFKCHQSGINALDLTSIKDEESFLMCTGGDDNSIGLAKISISSRCVLQHSKHFCAHSSQITGIKFVFENHLLSVSIDQRLILWKVDKSFQLVMMQSIMLDISDISDMLITKYSENDLDFAKTYGVWVVGRGVQRIRLSIET